MAQTNPKIQDTFFVSNAHAVKIKITNADRIRSMKDEKLAELLCGYQCNTCDFNGFCDETDKCEEKIIEWLKQENETN